MFTVLSQTPKTSLQSVFLEVAAAVGAAVRQPVSQGVTELSN